MEPKSLSRLGELVEEGGKAQGTGAEAVVEGIVLIFSRLLPFQVLKIWSLGQVERRLQQGVYRVSGL